MTFADFFKTINHTKVFECTREELVDNIYKAAGSSYEISFDKAKQWFNRNKPGQPTYYFPQYNIDNAGFIKYFQDNTSSSWTILLKAFRSLDDKGVINCNPKSASEFYLSLLEQFYKILGFPWGESERILEIFNQEVKNYNILDFLQNDSANHLHGDFFCDVDNFVQEIKEKICKFVDSNETLVDKIIEFNKLIDEYSAFLGVNMQPVDGSEFYVPLPQTNILVFRKEIISKIRDMEVLYNEIQNNNSHQPS